MDFYSNTMYERFEQVQVFTHMEYERRWALCRQVMERNDCEAMIVFDAFKEAYDQWMVGERFLQYAFISRNDSVVGIIGDGVSSHSQSSEPCYQHMPLRKPIIPVHPNIRFTEQFDLELLAGKAGKPSRNIAIVFPDLMSKEFYDAVTSRYPNIRFVDVTLEMSLDKSVKSDEEIQAIANANRVHEKIMLSVPHLLRQGRSVREIVNEITHMITTLGSGVGPIHTFMIEFGPQDGPSARCDMLPYPGYVLKKGDRGMVLLETNGPGGHVTAIGRYFTLGEPIREFQDTIDMTIKTQNFATAMLRPGVSLAEIARETRKFVEGNGFETNDQCFMHSLGYFYYEQCGINDISEHEPLRKNMFQHAHPVIKRRFPGAVDNQFILDAFLVGEEGGIRTNNIPQKLFVIE